MNVSDLANRISVIENGTLRKGLTLTGSATISGTLAVTGATAFTGLTTGVRKDWTSTSASSVTLVGSQSGGVFYSHTASTAFTLPQSASEGYCFTFICGAADKQITVNTASSNDKIVGKTHAADDGAALIPASGTGIKNTAATNVVGDFCTLVSNGAGIWYMIGSAGVWASQ